MKIHKIGLLSALLLLTGCSKLGIPDHDKDYVKSGMVAPITLPAASGLQLQDIYYPIPPTANLAGATDVSLIPPGTSMNQFKHGHKKDDS